MTLETTLGEALDQLARIEHELLLRVERVRAHRDCLTGLIEFLQAETEERGPGAGSRLEREALEYIQDPQGRWRHGTRGDHSGGTDYREPDGPALRAALDNRLSEHVSRAYRTVKQEERPRDRTPAGQGVRLREPRLDRLIDELGAAPVMEILGVDEDGLGSLLAGVTEWNKELAKRLERGWQLLGEITGEAGGK